MIGWYFILQNTACSHQDKVPILKWCSLKKKPVGVWNTHEVAGLGKGLVLKYSSKSAQSWMSGFCETSRSSALFKPATSFFNVKHITLAAKFIFAWRLF